MAAASTGRMSGMAAEVARTRQINRYLNTNLMPWDLEAIPDDWLTAIEALMNGLPRVQEWKSEVDQALKDLRARVRKQRVQ